MIQSQPNKYFENSIQTASPAQLLIMLCDGAIRFCKIGIDAIHKKQYIDANINICKVQDIVNEFIITLDRSNPISDSLLLLYDYFNFRLIEANMKKDSVPVVEVMGHLIELKETWITASKWINSNTPRSGT